MISQLMRRTLGKSTRVGVAAFALVLFGSLIMVRTVSAHEVKTDGTIGAILHVDPDDTPTAGEHSTFELYFSDTTGRLNLANCSCGINVQQNGKTIATQKVAPSGHLEATNNYTFSRPGDYTVDVTGTPKSGTQFQTFSLTYGVHVDPNPQANSQSIPTIVWIGLAILIIGVILVAVKIA